MLTLQAQHPAAPALISTSPIQSASGSATTGTSSSSPSPATPSSNQMADTSVVVPKPRRSSRHPLSLAQHSSSASSSSSSTFAKINWVDSPATASTPAPTSSASNYALPSASSAPRMRSRFGMRGDEVPAILLETSLPKGRFVQTFRLAPRALANLIIRLHGSYELLNFVHVSKQMQTNVTSLFEENDDVRDAFLVRCIRGYEPSTSPRASWLNKGIKIDLTDVELLLESDSVSLSAYPMHALRVIAASQSQRVPSSAESVESQNEKDAATSRFQTLVLSHSRFVAYLRHRTAPQALLMSLQDEDDAIPLSSDSSTGNLPELVFPSPLFYFNGVEAPVVPAYVPLPSSPTVPSDPKSLKKRGRKSLSEDRPPPQVQTLSKSKSASNLRQRSASVGSADPNEGRKSTLKRLSIKPKRKSVVPPPPPVSRPPLNSVPSFGSGSGSVTGTGGFSNQMNVSQFGGIEPPGSIVTTRSLNERVRSRSTVSMSARSQVLSQSFQSFPMPGRLSPSPSGRATPSNRPPSRPSSAGYKSTSPPSSAPGSHRKRDKTRGSFYLPSDAPSLPGLPGQALAFNRSMPFLSPPPPLPTGSTGFASASPSTYMPNPSFDVFPPSGDIHSLSQAFRLTRAPIFRVFVPCPQLNPAVMQACMSQLHAASLVAHLRAGDLVCNLGYVPEVGDDGEPIAGEGDCRGWMIFSGHELLPLTTKVPIPVRDPTFILNSPLYFSHVLSDGENPRYELVIPLTPDSAPPNFSLVRITREISVPPQTNTNAKGKKGGNPEPEPLFPRPIIKHKVNAFVWLARIECNRWGDEWILEAEGTKEGRMYLEGVIQETREGAGIEREWELVREKTGHGKVYIRKIHSA